LLTKKITLYRKLRGLLKSQEDYVPTITDIFKAKGTRTGIQEYQFSVESVSINIIDVSRQCPSNLRRKDQYAK
jgi:hypothetical protein